MNDNNEKLLIDAGLLAGAYFLVVNPLIGLFGDDPAEQQAIDSIITGPDWQNPFSPNFGLAYSAETGEQEDYTQASYNFIKANYSDPANLGTNGVNAALPYIYWAEKIYRSMGYLWIDDATVNAGFSAMTCQYEVSQMAQWLQYTYNVDLFNWIRHGQSFTPWDNGLKKSNLAEIINHVKSLPVFDTGQLIL